MSLSSLLVSLEWRLSPNRMPTSRTEFAVVVSPDRSKLVVIGGFGGDDGLLSSCLVFDLRTESWQTFPSMRLKRSGCVAVWLEQTIYAVGGFSANFGQLNTGECWSGSHWQSMPSMPIGRTGISGTIVNNNSIVIVGGCSRHTRTIGRDVDQFHVDTNRWVRLPDMLEPRKGCLVATAHGRIHVFGGAGKENMTIVNTAEVLDGEVWEALPNMPRCRAHGAAVLVGTDHVLLVGGWDEHQRPLRQVDCFDTVTRRWVTGMPSLGTARLHCAAVSVGPGQVCCLGGSNEQDVVLDTMETITIHPCFLVVSRFQPLLKQDDLPPSLWPHILVAGQTPEIIYHLLCSDRFRLDAVLLQP